jgi:hypothetical protein
MIYQEKIPPPGPLPLDEDETKLVAESLANDDRWVKNLIEGLAGISSRQAVRPPQLAASYNRQRE